VSELALVVPFEGVAPVVDELRERSCAAPFEETEPERWREVASFELAEG
jgi:hypothetical protein